MSLVHCRIGFGCCFFWKVCDKTSIGPNGYTLFISNHPRLELSPCTPMFRENTSKYLYLYNSTLDISPSPPPSKQGFFPFPLRVFWSELEFKNFHFLAFIHDAAQVRELFIILFIVLYNNVDIITEIRTLFFSFAFLYIKWISWCWSSAILLLILWGTLSCAPGHRYISL